MVPELEKPRVIEIQVRIDCNGCVQKIKKALHGINGIYDICIDLQQQKLTVVGWADPEKIIKAIKKTRKMATICTHEEAAQPQKPTPPPPAEGNPPPPDAGNPPPTENPPATATPPAEPPKEPPPPPPSENPAQEATPPPPAAPTTEETSAQPPPPPPPAAGPSEPKDVGEIHVIHHHPNQYGYSDHWTSYPGSHGLRREVPHYIATHSYNNYRPSPHISAYVAEYAYPQQNIRYEYADEYQNRSGNGDGSNITSIFSDENPNACRIV